MSGATPNGSVRHNHGILIDPTASQIGSAESRVRQTVQAIAVSELASVNSPQDVTTRNLLPNEDLDSGADNGWNGTDREFTQTGLTAGLNEVYQIQSGGAAQDKAIAILAVSNLASHPITSELTFQNATGGTFERLHTESLLLDSEVTGLLADPIIVKPDQDAVINQYAKEAGDDQVVYHGVVSESTNNTLEESSRFLSDQ